MDNFFREIDNLKIKPRNRILKGNSGEYRSSTLGDSMDFYDHRPYFPKDDIRKIDWKAYMRTNELYVREFIEEKQVHIKVILDNSLSMDFGNANKFQMAKILSTGIGYLALKQMDVFSLITVGNEAKVIELNTMGKENIYRIYNDIGKLQSVGETDYSQLFNIDCFTGGISFFISDFFGDNLFDSFDYIKSHNEEIIALHILSKEELDPKYIGEYTMVDSETEKSRKVYIDKEACELYKEKMDIFLNETQTNCLKRGIKYILGSTENSPSTILAEALGGIR